MDGNDANDSCASIVEERREEDGAPSKVRLRYRHGIADQSAKSTRFPAADSSTDSSPLRRIEFPTEPLPCNSPPAPSLPRPPSPPQAPSPKIQVFLPESRSRNPLFDDEPACVPDLGDESGRSGNSDTNDKIRESSDNDDDNDDGDDDDNDDGDDDVVRPHFVPPTRRQQRKKGESLSSGAKRLNRRGKFRNSAYPSTSSLTEDLAEIFRNSPPFGQLAPPFFSQAPSQLHPPNPLFPYFPSTGDPRSSFGHWSSTHPPTDSRSPTAALVPVDQTAAFKSLLEENESLRDQVSRVRKALRDKDAEIETLKLEASMHEADSDSAMASRVADVVDELYAAQKERDGALLRRIRAAERERDDAVERARRLERRRMGAGRRDEVVARRRVGSDAEDDDGSSSDEDNSDEEDDRRIVPYVEAAAASSAKLTKLRREEARKAAEEIAGREIKAAVEERDKVLAKCRLLEVELAKAKRTEVSKSDTDRRLAATVKERDLALAKLRRVEAELQEEQIARGLHRSLSQERELLERIKMIDAELLEERRLIGTLKEEKEILAEEIRNAMAEKKAAKKEAEAREAAVIEGAKERDKLERLVGVLRRKVGSLSLEKSRNNLENFT